MAELLDEKVVVGKFYAVFIAVGNYERWSALRNPVKDAQKIREILMRRYYVDHVTELHDEEATAAEITKLFINPQGRLQPEDSLFVYYAGHRHFDDASQSAYWIPVDPGAYPHAQSNWRVLPSPLPSVGSAAWVCQRVKLFV